MNSHENFDRVKQNAQNAPPLGHTIKITTELQHIYIDGLAAFNEVTKENHSASCELYLSENVLHQILMGQLDPLTGVIGGKIKINGDMNIALKLNKILKNS
ncbi:MAG: SCP2 sterol-binding domain-containing protein [Flavobacterium sp.]|nr:SCP2 sterol-binding domain-containing protein [Candidatus Neoflavobacterium equi]